MSTNAAGWHPDPLRRHHLRYWNGTTWTAHVSNGGTTSTDPHGTAPTPATATDPAPAQDAPVRPARKAYVDASLTVGLRSKRLFVDDAAIWWGDEAIPFAGATAYAHWATHVVAGPAHNYEFRIMVFHGKKSEKVTFGGRGEHPRQCFDATCDALLRHLGVRILEETVAKVQSGESVEVGGWTVDRSGATQRRKSFPWGTPLRYEAQRGQFAGTNVFRTDGDKDVKVGEFLLEVPNGPLVPRLFSTMDRLFA